MLWLCSIEKQKQDLARFDSLLQRLSFQEKQKIQSFLFLEDRCRAMLSILLQRAMIQEMFQLKDMEGYEIKRTSHNKPYLHTQHIAAGTCWNFNVSHHGNLVGILSSDNTLVGLDIVDVSSRNALSPTCASLCEMFTSHLTQGEIDRILFAPSEDERFALFYIHWSLKEAFVKAVGQGLMFNLLEIEFTLCGKDKSAVFEPRSLSGTATMTLRGESRPDWRFRFFSSDARHVVTVALGPLSDCEEEFREKAWSKCAFDDIAVSDEDTQREQDSLRVMDFDWLCQRVFSQSTLR